MPYFEYICKTADHSHRISTDINIRSERKLKCHFCKAPMQKVDFGFKKEKDAATKN
jgi:hypothetical protein